MWWTGVDMSTPLLPEVVPEIDTNPVSFYSEGGGWGSAPGPCWGSIPDPIIGSRSAHSPCVSTDHPTFFDLATPLEPSERVT